MEKDKLKRYYTIGEVADMFDVSKSLIRYWETEFNYLKPHKNSKGDRRFTPQNLDQLQLIYHLVKEREFTINGAREEIKRLQKVEKEKKEVLSRLESLKGFLEEIKTEL
jgi:DNA-binding transcriptional MerR regulator